MAQVINTNIPSINAQRNLNRNQNMMETAMARLSSGLRINSAKDDAAGLAIATRFDTQIRGLNQAVRNANDGISLAQTAEASMSEMTNILQRMRELAVQAANSSNSAADRASIQSEIDQLYDELDRIAENTDFNGTNILNGGAENITFQVGANSGETLAFSIDSVTTQDLNLNGQSGLGELNGGRVSSLISTLVLSTGDIVINGVNLSAATFSASFGTLGDNTSFQASVASNRADKIVEVVNAKTGTHGVTATAYNTYKGLSGASGVVSADALIINGNTVSASGSMEELVDNINLEVQGIVASLDASGAITLSNDTGQDIHIAGTVTNTGLTAGRYNGFVALTSSDNEEIDITIGTITTAFQSELRQFGFNTSTGSSDLTGGAVTSTTLSSSEDITINGVALGSSDSASAVDKAAAINAITSETGVSATASTIATYANLDFDQVVFNPEDIQINGVDVDLTTVSNVDDVVAQINNTTALEGVVASTNADGELVLTSNIGVDLSVTVQSGARTFFGSDVQYTSLLQDGVAVLNVGTDQALLSFFTGQFSTTQESVMGTSDPGRLVITITDSATGSVRDFIIDFATSTQGASFASVGIDSNFKGTIESLFRTATNSFIHASFNSYGQLMLEVNRSLNTTSIIGYMTINVRNDTTTNDSTTAAYSAFSDLAAGDNYIFKGNTNSTNADNTNRTRGTIQLVNDDGGDIIIDGVAVDVLKLGLTRSGGSEDSIGLGLDVTTTANASNAIDRIDDALDQISSTRADLGAVQNRLESTVSNLEAVSQNLASAQSRIQDADFAAETASLTKAQILQQVGISMLVQANANSQSVLSLLG